MTVVYHPDFAADVRRFASQYGTISVRLDHRFRLEVDEAIAVIKDNPTSAGHFLNTGSLVLREVRRRNLYIFPFFVLYGLTETHLVFGSLIPSASDPLTWLNRFSDATGS
ncbi:hypothetical protein ESB00_08925 [Oleiharenicola lentus]|jgi:hypothetical protein|uniref:Type II toxin-antitoxin system RelE/ParE family toxin n=1 Tax=Oleiharenicola lentus TaxID=2508720 RepID=A0A4Q1CAT4_9BACT|nr:hypothetical protein [Oleiharenicola lentus]RXK55982.1 hypothetical protein ESB00_08925 [Oleiharenicola lentus]